MKQLVAIAVAVAVLGGCARQGGAYVDTSQPGTIYGTPAAPQTATSYVGGATAGTGAGDGIASGARAIIPEGIPVSEGGSATAAAASPLASSTTPSPSSLYSTSSTYSGSTGGITCDGVYSAYANRDRDGDGIECERPVTKPSIGVTSSRPSYSGGTTYVRGYYRKDGTYVRGHTRRRRR